MKIQGIEYKDLEIQFEKPNKRNKKDFGITSAVIWASRKGISGWFPILYLKKPKAISDEEFNTLLESLELKIIIKK